MQRYARANCQNICLRPGFVLIVKADCAIGTKVISVSGFGGIAALDTVHSTAGFYNQNKPGAKAYILAVRARVPLHEDEE